MADAAAQVELLHPFGEGRQGHIGRKDSHYFSGVVLDREHVGTEDFLGSGVVVIGLRPVAGSAHFAALDEPLIFGVVVGGGTQL